MLTIKGNWGKATVDYMERCNTSKKYAKTVQKTANPFSWDEAHNFMTQKVVQQLDLRLKYGILNRLIID